jgi:hypothetical protein
MSTVQFGWCQQCPDNPMHGLSDDIARKIAHNNGQPNPGNGHFIGSHAMVLYDCNYQNYVYKNSSGSQPGTQPGSRPGLEEIPKTRPFVRNVYEEIYDDANLQRTVLTDFDPTFDRSTMFIDETGFFITMRK